MTTANGRHAAPSQMAATTAAPTASVGSSRARAVDVRPDRAPRAPVAGWGGLSCRLVQAPLGRFPGGVAVVSGERHAAPWDFVHWPAHLAEVDGVFEPDWPARRAACRLAHVENPAFPPFLADFGVMWAGRGEGRR